MRQDNIVDIFFKEFQDIVDYLSKQKQPSLSSDADKYFKKVLLLSSASYFEHEIKNILIDFVDKKINGEEKILNLLKKKAIGDQYYTFFNWGEKNEPNKPGKNANSFFSLFGENFKSEAQNEISNNIELDLSIKAFLEIGHLRNILVHSNFASYNLENKTADEIYELHKKASRFLEFIKSKFIESSSTGGR